MMGRKFNVSIFYLSQKFFTVPLFIRQNATIMFLFDLGNKTDIKKMFNDTFVASGVQIMPFSSNDGENVQRIINVAGSTFYPLAISLLMPLFMYTIVLEKEV